jgi:hypothetical protein
MRRIEYDTAHGPLLLTSPAGRLAAQFQARETEKYDGKENPEN